MKMHFSLFGLEKDFDIDIQKLEEQYNNLQFNVHPDYYIVKRILKKKEQSSIACILMIVLKY